MQTYNHGRKDLSVSPYDELFYGPEDLSINLNYALSLTNLYDDCATMYKSVSDERVGLLMKNDEG